MWNANLLNGISTSTSVKSAVIGFGFGIVQFVSKSIHPITHNYLIELVAFSH